MTWSDHLDEVLRAAHARLSRDRGAQSVTVDLAATAEREALADLMGMARRPEGRTRVRLSGAGGLAEAVAQASGRSLVDVIESLFGPLVDPAAASRAQNAERGDLWQWWFAQPFICDRPELAAWASEVKQFGARGGVAATRQLLERVLLVLGTLPAADELLPVLAGRLMNDTHALDANRVLTSHVLGAVAALQGLPRPADAAARRALWHSVGVRDDELSSTVLVAGLRPPGASSAAQICRLTADAGQATSLTLAQVRQHGRSWGVDEVFVVENPAIVALAVHRFGVSVPPMVCCAGWPSAAVTTLLDRVSGEGATVHHHGDFDGEGLRITAHLGRLVGARPWRMTTDDYVTSVAAHGASVGRVTEAPWDPQLAPALVRHGVAVLEETVWTVLAADLEAASHDRSD